MSPSLQNNHLVAVARNLEQAIAKGGTIVRFGYIDVERRVPVLAASNPQRQRQSSSSGVFHGAAFQQKAEATISRRHRGQAESDIKRGFK